LRRYRSKNDLPAILNGLGIAIISTPRGVMTDKSARQQGVGGEVLCVVA
jgi:small subunit ribosomal protein S8